MKHRCQSVQSKMRRTEKEQLHAGDVHYCPDGGSHSVENDADVPMRMLAIVLLHR